MKYFKNRICNYKTYQNSPSQYTHIIVICWPGRNYEDYKNESILPIHGLATICGHALPGTRIVGGEEAEIGAYPWLALLGYTMSGRRGITYACGGALIGNNYILTAAHCVTGLQNGIKL